MTQDQITDLVFDRWADKTTFDEKSNVVIRYYYLGASAMDPVVVTKTNRGTTELISAELC